MWSGAGSGGLKERGGARLDKRVSKAGSVAGAKPDSLTDSSVVDDAPRSSIAQRQRSGFSHRLLSPFCSSIYPFIYLILN